MRVIVTKDGVAFKGKSKDFVDNGDHIVCYNKDIVERIYKVNISGDRETIRETADDEWGYTFIMVLIIFILGLIVFLG